MAKKDGGRGYLKKLFRGKKEVVKQAPGPGDKVDEKIFEQEVQQKQEGQVKQEKQKKQPSQQVQDMQQVQEKQSLQQVQNVQQSWDKQLRQQMQQSWEVQLKQQVEDKEFIKVTFRLLPEFYVNYRRYCKRNGYGTNYEGINHLLKMIWDQLPQDEID